MNGVHDLGGLECFGPIHPDPEEPLFHADWEKRVLGMTLAIGATGTWNLDQSRFSRESLPPPFYLSAGYYRIWFAALQQLLLEHGLVSETELSELNNVHLESRVRTPPAPVKRVLTAANVPTVLAAGSPVEREPTSVARFAVGDQVRVRNLHPTGHTRLPGYIRGHLGTVHGVHGSHVFADAHARGDGESPQWLYNIRFSAEELWGTARDRAGSVHVDCWEGYLEIAE